MMMRTEGSLDGQTPQPEQGTKVADCLSIVAALHLSVSMTYISYPHFVGQIGVQEGQQICKGSFGLHVPSICINVLKTKR